MFELQAHEGFFPGDRIAISPDGKEIYYTEVTITWGDYNIRYYKYGDARMCWQWFLVGPGESRRADQHAGIRVRALCHG